MALNGRVLLLNQTYEPLGTVGVARAIIMTFKNTVFVEEWDGDRVLRSAHDEFPVPSVIRRRTYLNIRRRREQSGTKRLRIYMRDKFCCQYCGEKKGAVELTLDHIMPRSRGGDNSPVNVVTACVPCNNRKSNRTPGEARMPLLTSQTALRVKLERVCFATMQKQELSGANTFSWTRTMIVTSWRRRIANVSDASKTATD
jgi:5-methylcytosine-specific restriction endonuclease McrA